MSAFHITGHEASKESDFIHALTTKALSLSTSIILLNSVVEVVVATSVHGWYR